MRPHRSELLSDIGCKVVAVSDSKVALHDKEGLDIDCAILAKKDRNLSSYGEKEKLENNEDVLYIEVDFLIPAALGNVITKENATKIRAHHIMEIANGPTAPEADDILAQNHQHVFPDILVNAGGVIVSYLESVQNHTHHYFEEKEINIKLQQYQTTHRNAAIIFALQNIDQAIKARGWI
ncbi:glutamate dehydrogenase/leucine dehydrogenase [Geomicrobium halophilum]|uniref:Glutamate dehydrogenase/leucine dehydrogenase n=1 Tax=Geomicrobium halophilum TaxID=549000 RepID=A0A841PWC3_9BACL|nr:glutamate dehydrogenase/leucine dehydrogenase [Geomicrobium halophilum]